MTDEMLHALDATTLVQRYANGSLSPVDVTRDVLARIEAWEPSINAMYLVHAQQSLEAAAASEARWRSGAALSPLDGVPITIKENLYTRGDPAPIGTASGDTTPKGIDAPVPARAREAGCILLGKTTMPDFGMLSSGRSSFHGTTRNPWDTALNPSGSSSGAGAAGAAGYGPLHVGTDIGGSVRLPATHCGLFGLKPSLGRIPIDPPYLGRVAGPMTRTVADAAALLNVLARPDVRDFMSLPATDTDYTQQLESFEARDLRIGVLLDIGVGLPVQAPVVQAVQAAADALAAAGARVESTPTFMTEAMLDGMTLFFEARSNREIRQIDPARRGRILPFIVEWATYRANKASGYDIMQAYEQVVAMRAAATRAAAQFDYLLMPTSPLLPYDAQLEAPNADAHRALDHIAYTVPWNMSEHPAASLNWLHTAQGLPVGVQIVGQRFDDAGVLKLCAAMERLRPAQIAWPEPPDLQTRSTQR